MQDARSREPRLGKGFGGGEGPMTQGLWTQSLDGWILPVLGRAEMVRRKSSKVKEEIKRREKK